MIKGEMMKRKQEIQKLRVVQECVSMREEGRASDQRREKSSRGVTTTR